MRSNIINTIASMPLFEYVSGQKYTVQQTYASQQMIQSSLCLIFSTS